MKQRKLTAKEIAQIREAADWIEASPNGGFTCNVIDRITRAPYPEISELTQKYAKFYDNPFASSRNRAWVGLMAPSVAIPEQKIQRLLLLELFAHLKGEL